MSVSIERNDWTCGKEDLFEISVHRFETMLKGCSLSALESSRIFLFQQFSKFSLLLIRARPTISDLVTRPEWKSVTREERGR